MNNLSLGRAVPIVQRPEKVSKEMEEKISAIKERIAKISKMNLKEYINYKIGKFKEYEESDDF